MTAFSDAVETVSNKVWGETQLTKGALKGTLVAVIVPLFLGGLGGLDTFLGLLDLPTDPWIMVTAEYLSSRLWFEVQVPEYVLRVGATFTAITILLAFGKYWLSDRFVDDIDLQNLGKGEYWVIGVWLVVGPALLFLLNYPFTPVSVGQGILFIALQIAYGLIPGILVNTFVLPQETGSAVIKLFVALTALLLAFLFTGATVLGMEAVEIFL
jgi:hypothetical protein